MSRLALCNVVGPLNDLNQKLSGENGELWLERLKKMLRGETVQFRFTSAFDYNKTEDGWTLILDSKAKEGDFEPELIEFLRERESSVNGEEMLKRTEKEGLGQRYAEAMLRNQNAIPIEWREHALVFTGTVWRSSDGRRNVPYLSRYGCGWGLGFYWLDRDFGSSDRVVRPRK